MSSQESIDTNEPPLFDIDVMPEPDTEELVGGRGQAVTEGVTIPFDVLEFGNGLLPDTMLQPIGIGSHRLHAIAAEFGGAAGEYHVRHIADRRLERIGLTVRYGAPNPFPWMSETIDLKKEKNFFETRVTEYQYGGALSWD